MTHVEKCSGCQTGIPIFFSILFFLILGLFYGCATQGILQNVTNPTPEQIKAASDAGQATLFCNIVKGPPIGGQLVIITFPKTLAPIVTFGPDCQITTFSTATK